MLDTLGMVINQPNRDISRTWQLSKNSLKHGINMDKLINFTLRNPLKSHLKQFSCFLTTMNLENHGTDAVLMTFFEEPLVLINMLGGMLRSRGCASDFASRSSGGGGCCVGVQHSFIDNPTKLPKCLILPKLEFTKKLNMFFKFGK